MIFYIEDKEYCFDNDTLNDLYLSEGKEGTVYKYKNLAIKIYHEHSKKDRLDENTCELLKSINTKRILLPRKLVYNKDKKFIGYTTDYHQKYSLDNLKRMKIKSLKEELQLIKKDIELLSKNNITIDDLYIDNIILSDGLYFIDPGSFWISKNNRYLSYDNKNKMNNFIINNIFTKAGDIPKKKYQILNRRLNYDEFVDEALPNSKDSTHSYLKKLVM